MAWQVTERSRPGAADEARLIGAAAESSRVPEACRRLQAQLIRRVDGTRARRHVCVVMVAVSVVASFVCVALVVASVVANVV